MFSAYDADLGRQIALKVVRERYTGDRDSQMRIEREALARLSHPDVLQVHDVGDYCGHVSIDRCQPVCANDRDVRRA